MRKLIAQMARFSYIEAMRSRRTLLVDLTLGLSRPWASA